MTVDVRSARQADVPALSRVLARAFFDDPVWMWMLPDARVRAKRCAIAFAALTRHRYLAGGGVELASRDSAIRAAALWEPPGHRTSRRQDMAMMPGMVRAFRSRIGVGREVSETLQRSHPSEPHWYLALIGSDPAARGVGNARALMRSRLDRCDMEGAPAYLEATKRDTVPYYERFGFEVTGEIAIPNGGPSLWPMWRVAQ